MYETIQTIIRKHRIWWTTCIRISTRRSSQINLKMSSLFHTNTHTPYLLQSSHIHPTYQRQKKNKNVQQLPTRQHRVAATAASLSHQKRNLIVAADASQIEYVYNLSKQTHTHGFWLIARGGFNSRIPIIISIKSIPTNMLDGVTFTF